MKAGHKTPEVKWTKYCDTPASAQELAAWDASNFNVGIICGEPSNIVVLDVDSIEAQRAVDDLHLPPTPRVKTAKGCHYYFRRPSGGIRNTTRIAGLKLDFRGDGGYVVGNGSIHESGHAYKWEVSPNNVPFAELPASVLSLMAQPSERKGAPKPIAASDKEPCGQFTQHLAETLSEAISTIQATREGARNDTVFRAGVKLANDVAGAGTEWVPFAEALREAALKIGLTSEETDATLASCWKSGSADPTPWMLTANRWIYLSKPDVFYHIESREYLKSISFNNKFMFVVRLFETDGGVN